MIKKKSWRETGILVSWTPIIPRWENKEQKYQFVKRQRPEDPELTIVNNCSLETKESQIYKEGKEKISTREDMFILFLSYGIQNMRETEQLYIMAGRLQMKLAHS